MKSLAAISLNDRDPNDNLLKRWRGLVLFMDTLDLLDFHSVFLVGGAAHNEPIEPNPLELSVPTTNDEHAFVQYGQQSNPFQDICHKLLNTLPMVSDGYFYQLITKFKYNAIIGMYSC